MGGCCCSSRKAQLQGTPVYYYCPRSLEEHGNLRQYNGTTSALPAGLLVGLNLDASSPDTFRPPPAPIPFNVLFGRPQTPIHARGSQGPKGDAPRKSIEAAQVRDNVRGDSCNVLVPTVKVDKPDGKTLADILLASPTKSETEISKPPESHQFAIEEEDGCPICLEEYDTENPKMLTNCEHDFHLSCLLEWMERSDCCPVCDKILHAGAGNKNALKSLIAAEYSGVNVELAKDFQMGVSNKTPEFLKMNPIGKVPVLETPEGPVFESNAIARYVARLKADNPLYGSSLIDYAHIEQWMDFSATEVDASIGRWLYPRLGFAPHLPPAEEHAIASLKRALDALNKHLASNTYLVGHGVTLADIVMTCNLYQGFKNILTKPFTKEFPHVERYFWTMVNQPNFKKHLGEVTQATSVPPVAKKAGQAPAKAKAKEEPKKEAPKPKEAPAPAPAAEEEAPKPKPKNPLDLLPPSKMILDDWKRLYSNTKTNFREVAIKGFWDMYDPEGYSLWFCDYKYNDENTVSFVTLNKVTGFLQRMDLARKYAFGKMLIIGGNPPYKVKGLWLFRGPEIPEFVLDECYDMELYEWKKVDINDEEQKERVNQMIEDQEPFEGEPLLDAKCFK